MQDKLLLFLNIYTQKTLYIGFSYYKILKIIFDNIILF